jgi:hypothetical protein
MMLRLILPVLLVAMATFSPPLYSQERKLDPVDEAAKDASWASFKKRLLTAVEKRDRKFILSILDKAVRSGTGGGRGVAAFRKQWELDTDASPLWHELSAVLSLPAAHHRPEKGPLELCVPYVAVRWPQDIDAFAGGAITAREALVKAGPSSTSLTIATLSYHIVEVADWEVTDQAGSRQVWVKIKLKTGEGYVPEEQIRSPVEHAACFVKDEASWRLVGFGPGSGK